MEKKWYILHTQTGCEMIAKSSIEERVRSKGKQDSFGEILIPVENVVELVKGKKQTRSKKFFPGYIFIQMIMNEDNWYLVQGASKVSGFVGGSKNPPEVPEAEVKRINQQMVSGAEKPKHRFNFSMGENVVVVDGPFSNFTGIVEDVNEDKGKVKVLVSIFGRPTPVELDFVQIERA